MASLLPNGKSHFEDNNGKPLSGGKVYFYIPNTSTFKNTYQDENQTILNTNPIVLNARGEAVIWGSGEYRQVVYDRFGNLVWDLVITANASTLDLTQFKNSIAASTGASLVGLAQGGTVQSGILYLTPQMFFIAGEADNTGQFQRAIIYAMSNGYKELRVPAGEYVISNTINTGGSGYAGTAQVPIKGAGIKSTIFKFKGAAGIPCFKTIGGSGIYSGSMFSDFTILPYSSDYAYLGYGIEYSGCCFVHTDSVEIEQLDVGFRFHNDTAGSYTEFCTLTRCRPYKNNINVQYIRTGGNDSFHGCDIFAMQNQVRNDGAGGIGLQLIGVSESNIAYLYNAHMDIKFFGGSGCRGIDIQFANTEGLSGNITGEQNLSFGSDDNSLWVQDGALYSIGGVFFDVPVEEPTKLGRFVWNNRTSNQTTNFLHAPLTAYTPGLPYRPVDISAQGTGGFLFRAVGSGMNSPVFSCLGGGSDNGFYFGNINPNGRAQDWNPGFFISAGGGILNTYNTAGLQISISGNSLVTMSTASLRPTSNGGLNLGADTVRWGAGYYTGWNITNASIIPTAAGVSNIGSNTNYPNNIYAGNNLIVVSDRNKKSNIKSISDDILDAWEKIPFSMFTMNIDIEKYGSEAKTHFGLIAQNIKEVFDSCGIDALGLGILYFTAANAEAPETWMVCVTECLILEAACNRRKLDRVISTLNLA